MKIKVKSNNYIGDAVEYFESAAFSIKLPGKYNRFIFNKNTKNFSCKLTKKSFDKAYDKKSINFQCIDLDIQGYKDIYKRLNSLKRMKKALEKSIEIEGDMYRNVKKNIEYLNIGIQKIENS